MSRVSRVSWTKRSLAAAASCLVTSLVFAAEPPRISTSPHALEGRVVIAAPVRTLAGQAVAAGTYDAVVLPGKSDDALLLALVADGIEVARTPARLVMTPEAAGATPQPAAAVGTTPAFAALGFQRFEAALSLDPAGAPLLAIPSRHEGTRIEATFASGEP